MYLIAVKELQHAYNFIKKGILTGIMFCHQAGGLVTGILRYLNNQSD